MAFNTDNVDIKLISESSLKISFHIRNSYYKLKAAHSSLIVKDTKTNIINTILINMHLSAFRKSWHHGDSYFLGLSDLESYPYPRPLGGSQSRRENDWALQFDKFEDEKKFIQQVLMERMALQEALIKDSVKMYFSRFNDDNKSNWLISNRSNQFKGSSGLYFQSNSDLDGGKLRTRTHSVSLKRVPFSPNPEAKNLPATKLDQSNQATKLLPMQQKKQKDSQFDYKAYKNDNEPPRSGHFKTQQTTAHLKSQLQQKNKIIVDLQCRLLKLENAHQQLLKSASLDLSKKPISPRSQRFRVQSCCNISIAPKRNAFSISNLITVVTQQKILECKEKNNSFYTSITEKMEETKSSHLNSEQLFNNFQPSLVQQCQFQKQICKSIVVAKAQSLGEKQESLTQSILMGPKDNESSLDLTLSISQVVSPLHPGLKEKLVLLNQNVSGWQHSNTSASASNESVVIEIEEESGDNISQAKQSGQVRNSQNKSENTRQVEGKR